MAQDTTFPERLKYAMGTKSVRAFALGCGISPTGFHQNLTGKAEPSRTALISIASTAGVSIEWLITGQGPKKVGAIDSIKLSQHVLEIVEQIFQVENIVLPPSIKAEFIIDIIEEILEEPSKIDLVEAKTRKYIEFHKQMSNPKK